MIMGDSETFKKAAEVLDMFTESIIDIYELRTGLSRETIKDLMNRETFINAQTACDMKFADEYIKDEPKPEPEPVNKMMTPPVNFLPVKEKINPQEQAVNLMAGFINGKRKI